MIAVGDPARRRRHRAPVRTRGVPVHLGDPGDSLLVIADGLVKVTISSPDGVEVVLATMGRSESLGELAVLDGAPRSASVVAAESTVVIVLGRRELLNTMSAHPAVMDAVLVSLGALVRRLTETTGDLVFLDLGGRLAKALLRLAGDQKVIDLGLTQSDIAAMVGAGPAAVNSCVRCSPDEGGSRSTPISSCCATRRRWAVGPAGDVVVGDR